MPSKKRKLLKFLKQNDITKSRAMKILSSLHKETRRKEKRNRLQRIRWQDHTVAVRLDAFTEYLLQRDFSNDSSSSEDSESSTSNPLEKTFPLLTNDENVPQSSINCLLPSASSNGIEALKKVVLTEDKEMLADNGLQKQCSTVDERKQKSRTRDSIMAKSKKDSS